MGLICIGCKYNVDCTKVFRIEKENCTEYRPRTNADRCPLVPVPPHGRLIDADACEDYFFEHLSDASTAGAMNAIEEMPTIIPAEEGR